MKKWKQAEFLKPLGSCSFTQKSLEIWVAVMGNRISVPVFWGVVFLCMDVQMTKISLPTFQDSHIKTFATMLKICQLSLASTFPTVSQKVTCSI